ncbi:MAG: DUF3823 domain-containing protein [Chitinophagaceae bacterium]|nr:DUF3823 domain-containing protein [Chitinophagaceae bacterium]
MKIYFKHFILFALIASIISCKKDNYEEPTSLLNGRIVYQGEALNVEHNQVPFELYQYGFGKTGAISGTFTQDGTYSALLFDGNYKFIIPGGQGPFLSRPDSMNITMQGSQTLDIEVTPYFMVRTPMFTASGGIISASAKIEKIVTDPANAKDIESISLYLNKTQFVSSANNLSFADSTGASIMDLNNVTLSASVPAIVPTQNYVFARIGIKIAGVEDRIFSPVQKIQL